MNGLHVVIYPDGTFTRCRDLDHAELIAKEFKAYDGKKIVYQYTPPGGGVMIEMEYDKNNGLWNPLS